MFIPISDDKRDACHLNGNVTLPRRQEMLTQEQLKPQTAMPITKIRGFFKEFPWVRNLRSGPVSQVYVSRLEPELLEYHPAKIDESVLFGQDMVYEELYLVNEAGTLVTGRWEETVTRRKFFFGPKKTEITTWFFNGWTNKATIWSIIQRLGEKKAEEIRFVVSYYGHTKAVILYKLQSGMSFTQWMERETDLQADEFSKAAAEI